MEFTATYRQTTKQRRRCMICSRLIKDGQLAFFKGQRGRQGKAVHDACRDGEESGGWYARDCATSYVQGRHGHWTLVTDHDLEAAQMAVRREADAKRFRDEHPELEAYFKQMEKEQQHG